MATKVSLVEQGGWPFLITALVGRLPPAMIQLGLLMYVSGVGLGLGLGGFTVAAVGLGTAFGAPLMGRLVDAVGPLPVVLGATVVQVSGLVGIHLLTPGLVAGDLPSAALLAVAWVCGFANPQVGPITRSHWSHIARERRLPKLVSQALGYEGAMDEMSFIVGPVAASLLVALLGPTPAIFTLMGIVLTGQGVFAVYLWLARDAWRRSAASATRAAGSGTGRIPFGALLPPMVVLLAVGITFGATQTALTALNAARGTDHLTGIVYGAVGIGSAVSSLMTPRLPLRFGPGKRLVAGSSGLLLAALAMMLLPGFWGFLAIAIALGLAIGIILVTGFSRAEEVAPSTRIASVMTMLSMCLTLGVSIGAASAGQLSGSLSLAFAPVVVAGVLALVASVLIALGRRAARRGGAERP